MEGLESDFAASELETLPAVDLPAAAPSSVSDSRQQIPRSRDPGLSPEHTRTGMSPETLMAAFQDNLNYVTGRPLHLAAPEQRYEALAQTVRDRIMQRWVKQMSSWNRAETRNVAYLSAEFLLGPHPGNNLFNLGITENARRAMAELGLDLEQLVGLEEEPGLGNGGLGRLAACYLDSLATLGLNRAFQNSARWTGMSIMNTARMGEFSSDRAIDEYARKIWNLSSLSTRTIT
jgi:glucan phosphorylase